MIAPYLASALERVGDDAAEHLLTEFTGARDFTSGHIMLVGTSIKALGLVTDEEEGIGSLVKMLDFDGFEVLVD